MEEVCKEEEQGKAEMAPQWSKLNSHNPKVLQALAIHSTMCGRKKWVLI